MKDLIQQEKQSPKFDVLPLPFKKQLKFAMGVKWYDTEGHKFERDLLHCINEGVINTGNSPIYKDRIEPDITEFNIWFELMKNNPLNLVLVYSDEFEKYFLLPEIDIAGSIFAKKYFEKGELKSFHDLNEMLSTLVEMKKNNQKLFGNLPYLGKQKKDGRIFLFEEEIVRPDYIKIKSKKMISLKNGIRILLGLENISLLAEKEKDLEKMLEFNRMYARDWMITSSGLRPDETLVKLMKLTIKFKDEWRDILTFLDEFLTRVTLEVEAGFLERFNKKDVAWTDNKTISDIVKDFYSCHFKTLPFLKWIKEAGYEIPDELFFIENEDGTLKWADSGIDNDIKSHKTNDLSNLLGKERQEFGRLKTEKITMNSTVRAAVSVGQYVQTAITEGRLIVKEEIIDLINSIDRKIPNTRIDLIWKSIPGEVKNGIGRPRKNNL